MIKIGVIGLGYVGLPVSVLFSKKYKVVGYDNNPERISELNQYKDFTNEVEREELKRALDKNFKATDKENDLKDCNFYIITVPTPISDNNSPNLKPLQNASKMVGLLLSKNDVVVFESTVYPGCTEEICVPILEKFSCLKFNKEFFCGYSPERINPGDKEHSIEKIIKVTSGSTSQTANLIDKVYSSVIMAGTFKASSIRVAEAAKVIENTQRDINIAFINELSMLFNKINLDTTEVLEAASTKWNFLKFKPGLVGGHCIGVDPYYLSSKAIKHGFYPEIILAGRKINDGMGYYIAKRITNELINIKEICPDIRNTKVVDLVRGLKKTSLQVDLYDPWVESKLFEKEFGLKITNELVEKSYDLIVLAVSHRVFKKLDLKKLRKTPESIIYDIKGFYGKDEITHRL